MLAADALELGGSRLATLREETIALLGKQLPFTWSRGNPIDIIGDAPVSRYQHARQVLLAAPEVDGGLFMHAPSAIVAASEIALSCLPSMQTADKPVLTCWLGGATVAAASQATAQAGVATYGTPERAVAAWLQLVNHARNQHALQQLPHAAVADFIPDRLQVQLLLEQARDEGREWLDSASALALLRAYGIPTVATVRVADAQQAVVAADEMGYPVALKIVSPQIIHKSDVGGVMLGLASADEVRNAAIKMTDQLQQQLPQAALQGFAVQAMAQRKGSHELIVGVTDDAVFSPALLATLQKVSQLACDQSCLAELDINPLLVDEQGVLALNARVRLLRSSATSCGSSRLAICPYPAEREDSICIDGSQLLLRPIRPEDGERLKAFYAAASPSDMRLRFFMSRREVPHSELARYSQIDYDREMAFVALAGQAMVAEVPAVCDPDNLQVEFAIQVASQWQGKGLGHVLLSKLIRNLRERGTAEIVGQCLPDNAAMAALARRAGFEVSFDPMKKIMALRLVLRR